VPTSRLKYSATLLWLLTVTANPADLHYTDSGALIVPEYREWVFLSSGIDMSYTEKPAMDGVSMFDNVFVDRASWALFLQKGHWPDKTVFALENRGARVKGSINNRGHFQTEELMGVEFHVRDESRFKGGWGFFVANGTTAALLPDSAPCYSCHQAHGATDTTFTQFYPTAKPVAEKAGNFHSN
jgi:hypothetical protein